MPVKAAAVATFAVVLKAFLLDILMFFISRFSSIFPVYKVSLFVTILA
jgi:hypothetical protein